MRRQRAPLKAPTGHGLPSIEQQHLTALAFIAALARARGIAIDSADSIYIAGYEAKRLQLGRHPNPFERDKLRAAANRIWNALHPAPAREPQLTTTNTTGVLPWATASR